jgi:hypothetical protein
MALNITEAIAAQALIRWVSTLTLWERTDPNPDLDEADERLLEHVRVLAKSASKTLGAGPSPDEAADAVRTALGLP